jgi:hypothetical protein
MQCARISIAVMLLFAVSPLMRAAGQSPGKTRETAQKAEAADTTGVTIDFSGGSLGEYVRELKRRNPWANIVCDEKNIGDLVVPAVHLHNAELEESVGWLQALDAARGRAVTVQPLRRSRRGGGGFFIGGRPAPTDAEKAQPKSVRPEVKAEIVRQVRVYSLSGLAERTATRSVQPTVVTDNVKSLLRYPEAKKQQEGPDAKFDDTSGLLWVYGTPQELTLAAQLIEEMTQGRRQASAVQKLQTDVDTLNRQLKREIERLEAEITKMKTPPTLLK